MLKHTFAVVVIAALCAPVHAQGGLKPEDPAAPESADMAGQQCTPEGLFDNVRDGLKHGSQALQTYFRALLKEAALSMPSDVLVAAFEREQDPAMIEALGAALATKAENVEDPTLIQRVLLRGQNDSDPALRAAAVASLRSTGSVELMKHSGVDVDYGDLIKDSAPEVRKAVVENLAAEDKDVYSGHSPELAAAALDTALGASDPKATAQLLSTLSTEQVNAAGAEDLARALDHDNAAVRRAAALAMGGLPPQSADAAALALVRQYHRDDDLGARLQVLSSLARLQRAAAIPTLQGLRSVDERLSAEIDAWVTVLARNLPEWALIVREKDRLQAAQAQ